MDLLRNTSYKKAILDIDGMSIFKEHFDEIISLIRKQSKYIVVELICLLIDEQIDFEEIHHEYNIDDIKLSALYFDKYFDIIRKLQIYRNIDCYCIYNSLIRYMLHDDVRLSTILLYRELLMSNNRYIRLLVDESVLEILFLTIESNLLDVNKHSTIYYIIDCIYVLDKDNSLFNLLTNFTEALFIAVNFRINVDKLFIILSRIFNYENNESAIENILNMKETLFYNINNKFSLNIINKLYSINPSKLLTEQTLYILSNGIDKFSMSFVIEFVVKILNEDNDFVKDFWIKRKLIKNVREKKIKPLLRLSINNNTLTDICINKLLIQDEQLPQYITSII